MVSSLCYVLIPVIVVIGLLRKCRERAWGRCRSTSNLDGRVFLVTGANSGIGKETTRELAKRNATVVMACRDVKNAEVAIADIRRKTPTGNLVPMELDLASLESIRRFAKNVKETFPEIHVLINNAGVYVPYKEHALTREGFELHFGVNHLGHFLLTHLLLDKLKKSSPSRVVVVTSKLLESGKIDFSNLNGEKGLVPRGRMNPGYCNSKLLNMYFSMELSKRLQGNGVNVYAVCPGFTFTGLFRHVKRRWYHYVLFSPVALLYLRTANQGAQTVLHCATESNLSEDGGILYRDCKPYVPKKDLDPDVSFRLWEISKQLVGIVD